MENIKLYCTGCDKIYDLYYNAPVFSCENFEKDSTNHILEKSIDSEIELLADNCIENNPYLAFREFYFSYHLALHHNIDYAKIITKINKNLINIGEPGFSFTELYETDILYKNKKISCIIKDETVNVAGSHKARHLMGNIIYLEVLRLAGVIKGKPKLAIYSCGNAAMGASAVAKAAGYELQVFIPDGVDSKIIDFLNNYDAKIIICPRIEGESGDPCYNRFKEALQKGAVPFSCSGPDNWPNIEGGQSLCQELLLQSKLSKKEIGSIVIQVGGGALASSAVKTIEEFYEKKIIKTFPKIFTVQTEGCFPLVRAYYLLLKEIAVLYNLTCSFDYSKRESPQKDNEENSKIISYISENNEEIKNLADFIKGKYFDDKIQNLLKQASRNKNDYMWAWETEPRSIAHGILDDITYDWFKIIQGMLRTGGSPCIVNENALKNANKLGRKLTNINVDHTGTSGFAGFLKCLEFNWISEKNYSAIIFTGVKR